MLAEILRDKSGSDANWAMAAIHIYADGSGRPRGGFGWLVQETGKSHYESRKDITNNQAEYMAIISALHHIRQMQRGGGDDVDNYDNIIILSDSLNTVRQLNHEYAINNDVLRELAAKAWSEIAQIKANTASRDTSSHIGDETARDSSDSGGRGRTCSLQIIWVPRSENLAGKMLGS